MAATPLSDPLAERPADLSADRPRSPRGCASAGPALAIDAALRTSQSGIGRYTARLLESLEAGPLGGRVLPLSPRAGRSRTLWMLGEVPARLRREGAVLFHGLANFDLPWTKPAGLRYVLTVQDLIPLDWPQSVSRPYRLQFEVWLSRSVQLADRLVCTTQTVADRLRQRFPHAAPIRVIPLAVDPRPPARRRDQGAPYLLYVGTLEARKNLLTLLQAFARAKLAGVELRLLGHLAYGGAEVAREVARLQGAGVAVRWLGPQTRGQLERSLQGALALCSPSLAEGFGLPPLEAMALGTPVIASAIAAHREVLGEAALLVDPLAVDGWTEALKSLAEGGAQGAEALRERLSIAGRARAAGFTWDRTARATEALYAELVE